MEDIEIINRLSAEYTAHEHEELYKSVMDVIVRANKERIEEAKDMCEALREIWEEVLEFIQKKYSFTREEVEECMKLYW